MSRRIAIIGNAGGGKTPLARQLGQATGLPVHHLDNLLWQPGWQRLPEAEFDREHDALIAQPAWVIDGVAYGTSRPSLCPGRKWPPGAPNWPISGKLFRSFNLWIGSCDPTGWRFCKIMRAKKRLP